jgi:hypothetical protein
MRVFTCIVIGMLLCSSVLAVGQKNESTTQSKSLSVTFQEPSIIDNEQTVSIGMQGAPACLYQAGKPVLPMYTTTWELPFGSIIKDIYLDTTPIQTALLSKRITSAPYPVIGDTAPKYDQNYIDTKLYSSSEFYPTEWFSYSTGGGLNNQSNHVTFVTLQVYPVRYSPATRTISYVDQIDITVTYTSPEQSPFPTNSIYDLVIITPALFVLPLKRLAEHKNSIGIRTQIKTLESIDREYNGADKPEEIKLFIKDAVENWGIKYVLLIGGLRSHFIGKPRDNANEGSRDWYLPVRYSNLWDEGDLYDPGFICDLYFADLYDSQGDFCNWDSGGDGIYGGWSGNPSLSSPPDYVTDQIDFYPDVYVGRLPCRNIREVSNMVNKIITYEKTPADPTWFQNVVAVSGDPYDDSGTDYNEGELVTEKALTYLPGYQYQRLYASNKDSNPLSTPLTSNIIREINKGCGFLFFDGHGSPVWWDTYWPGEFTTLIRRGGLSYFDIYKIHNADQLPICVIGGCHCCQFNVSVLSTLTDIRNTHSMWTFGVPLPECLGWALTMKSNGGAIATIGSTGLGYEASGDVGDLNGDALNEPDCVEALGGYLQSQFFKSYGLGYTSNLGDTWGNAICGYLAAYPGMKNRSDAKTIEQWVLLGDPSLMIGGYGQ